MSANLCIDGGGEGGEGAMLFSLAKGLVEGLPKGLSKACQKACLTVELWVWLRQGPRQGWPGLWHEETTRLHASEDEYPDGE